MTDKIETKKRLQAMPPDVRRVTLDAAAVLHTARQAGDERHEQAIVWPIVSVALRGLLFV